MTRSKEEGSYVEHFDFSSFIIKTKAFMQVQEGFSSSNLCRHNYNYFVLEILLKILHNDASATWGYFAGRLLHALENQNSTVPETLISHLMVILTSISKGATWTFFSF